MTSIDDIPVAHTPTGGLTAFPPPILADAVDPLVDAAPDLRGVWRVIEVTVDETVLPDHPAMGKMQRIEQAGDRLVVTAGRIVHDMRCDGTERNGVHDVAEFDLSTPIHVVATYERGVHVLRPQGVDFEVRRWRDGEHMMWQYVGFDARLERLGPPDFDLTQEMNRQ
jgi:hypothetical protein